jgi:hypothetical protein
MFGLNGMLGIAGPISNEWIGVEQKTLFVYRRFGFTHTVTTSKQIKTGQGPVAISVTEDNHHIVAAAAGFDFQKVQVLLGVNLENFGVNLNFEFWGWDLTLEGSLLDGPGIGWGNTDENGTSEFSITSWSPANIFGLAPNTAPEDSPIFRTIPVP